MDKIQKGSKSASEALVAGIDFANGEIELNHHREMRTINELAQLDLSFGITRKVALTLAIPFRNDRLHEHFVEVGTPDESFSRQDGTSGFGDLRLIGKYAILTGTRHLLVGALGIKAPTGEYKLLNFEGKINEPTIQPGSGSWDSLVSTYYTYRATPQHLNAFFSASYQVATENKLGYKFGNTMLLNVGMNYIFSPIEKPWTVSLQVNMRQTPHDEFKGEKVPGTGGTWVYLTPGFKVQSLPGMAFYTHVQLPVYQYVNETNLVPSYGLILGVSHAF